MPVPMLRSAVATGSRESHRRCALFVLFVVQKNDNNSQDSIHDSRLSTDRHAGLISAGLQHQRSHQQQHDNNPTTRTTMEKRIKNQDNTWDGDTYVYRGGKVHRHEKKEITHVIVVDDTVTKIENQAFQHCSMLESVEFLSSSSPSPSSLMEVGNCAFFECSSLRFILLPSSVQKIGKKAFWSCGSLTSPIFSSVNPSSPETSSSSSPSLRIIEKDAFYGCGALTSIDFPPSLEKLSFCSFGVCQNLTSVTFAKDSKIEEIPTMCFLSCRKLKKILLPNSAKNNNKLTSLSALSFSQCEELEEIQLPDSIQTIGKSTFECCTALESIEFPSNTKEINSGALQSCRSLKFVKFEAGTALQTIHEVAFFNCKSLERVVLPRSLRTIDSCAFARCPNLKSIDFANSTRIPTTAPTNGIWDAEGCYFIKNAEATIRIPPNLEYIASTAFGECKKLNDLIDWQVLSFVCDVHSKARPFLLSLHECPIALRPYALCRYAKQQQEQKQKQQIQFIDWPGIYEIEKENTNIKTMLHFLNGNQIIIHHTSFVYFLLVQDGSLWEQQQKLRNQI